VLPVFVDPVVPYPPVVPVPPVAVPVVPEGEVPVVVVVPVALPVGLALYVPVDPVVPVSPAVAPMISTRVGIRVVPEPEPLTRIWSPTFRSLMYFVCPPAM